MPKAVSPPEIVLAMSSYTVKETGVRFCVTRSPPLSQAQCVRPGDPCNSPFQENRRQPVRARIQIFAPLGYPLSVSGISRTVFGLRIAARAERVQVGSEGSHRWR
jgi:hypothetical protein